MTNVNIIKDIKAAIQRDTMTHFRKIKMGM